jgi:hypothetical protein
MMDVDTRWDNPVNYNSKCSFLEWVFQTEYIRCSAVLLMTAELCLVTKA